MAVKMIDVPRGEQADLRDWNISIYRVIFLGGGYMKLTLKNLNTALAPLVVRGSRFEFNGCFFCVTGDTGIRGEAKDNEWVYIYVMFDHITKECYFEYNSTKPEYDQDKCAWYHANGHDMAIAKMYKTPDGYYGKVVLDDFDSMDKNNFSVIPSGGEKTEIDPQNMEGYVSYPNGSYEIELKPGFYEYELKGGKGGKGGKGYNNPAEPEEPAEPEVVEGEFILDHTVTAVIGIGEGGGNGGNGGNVSGSNEFNDHYGTGGGSGASGGASFINLGTARFAARGTQGTKGTKVGPRLAYHAFANGEPAEAPPLAGVYSPVINGFGGFLPGLDAPINARPPAMEGDPGEEVKGGKGGIENHANNGYAKLWIKTGFML
jgi:hypothetical protein